MRSSLVLLTVIALAACNGPQDDDRTASEDIADDYKATIDEAAALEAQLEASKQRVDEALDEAEDGATR